MVISLLWFGVAATITTVAYIGKENGVFVYQSIPDGKLVTGSTIKLPDGRKIPLSEQEEFEFALRLEKERGKGATPTTLVDPDAVAAPPNEKKRDKGEWDVVSIEPVKVAAPPNEKERDKSVQTVSEIRWARLVLLGMAIPLLLWLLAEFAVIVIRWIGKGFKKPNS